MNQDFSDDSAASAAIRLNLEPYHQRIYELEGRLHHIKEAYVSADRLRTEYQLQLEELHDAVKGLKGASGGKITQNKIKELLALRSEQRKTNQP